VPTDPEAPISASGDTVATGGVGQPASYWPVLVANARAELDETFDQRHWFNSTMDCGRLRERATKAQRLAFGDAVGLVWLVAIIAAILTPLTPHPWPLCAVLAAIAVSASLAKRYLLRDVVLHLGRDAVEVADSITVARREIAAGAARGNLDAGRLEGVIAAMMPGVEELLVDLTRLEEALRRLPKGSIGSAIAGEQYTAALLERRDAVRGQLLDVLAEVTAAAHVMFATRPDLPVHVPAPATVLSQRDVPVTSLTESGQRSLTVARSRLAALAEEALTR
jgi:hypothetical protein